MSKILLVEDDPMITASLIDSLTDLGHTVQAFGSGAPAVSAILQDRPDLLLLDLGLPDVGGATVLAMLRAVSNVPVIVITARTREEEAIRLLDLGADDYVTKPFLAAHLAARIRAVLRRTGQEGEAAFAGHTELAVGALVLDTGRRSVTLAGRQVPLRRREYQLLHALARRDGRVATREELLAEVWDGATPDDAQLDVQLSLLRAKLGESGREQRYIQTVRGVGVRLVDPDA